MITELGHFCLILAMLVAFLQCVVPFLGTRKNSYGMMNFGATAANLQFALLALAFGALTHAFITSDFSVRLVALNSHSLKPLLYKISGVWGNHEGSMLLWVLILALFGASAVWFGSNLPIRLKATVLSVQGAVGLAFLIFIVFTSNPFLRIFPIPFDGQDLNPLLQDPGLAFHPPFLYLGYVGLSMSFSFAVAALIEGRIDAAWGRWVRPWTLAAWLFLTIGIALGSWWAYYELGWGGFWFWDPVENASFIPWLCAAALLHSAIVVEKRENLKSWTILLAILAFGFSLTGTFIVRSGLLTSVHAFANDPERGFFILLIFCFFVGGALTLFAFRSNSLQAKGVFSVVSRESSLVANNILLVVSAFVVFVGTIWPYIAEMFFDRKLSVGPPFFNIAFTPFMVALGLILPIGAMVPWKRGRLNKILKSLLVPISFAILLACFVWALQSQKTILGPMGLFLGVWIVIGALYDLYSRTGSNRNLLRLLRLPRSDWGKTVAHVGFGTTIFAISALVAWESEDIRTASIGETWSFSGYDFTLQSVENLSGPNYFSVQASIKVVQDGEVVATLFPEKRNYPVAQMPTTEAAIDYKLTRDVYLVLGDRQLDGNWTVRTYIKPFANWIWAGCIIMALGALISLSDRRYRVAAGAKSTPRIEIEKA